MNISFGINPIKFDGKKSIIKARPSSLAVQNLEKTVWSELDSSGVERKIVQEIDKKANRGEITSTILDKNGKPAEITVSKYNNGELETTTSSFKYGDDGNIAEQTTCKDINNKFKEKTVSSFEYAPDGRLVKQKDIESENKRAYGESAKEETIRESEFDENGKESGTCHKVINGVDGKPLAKHFIKYAKDMPLEHTSIIFNDKNKSKNETIRKYYDVIFDLLKHYIENVYIDGKLTTKKVYSPTYYGTSVIHKKDTSMLMEYDSNGKIKEGYVEKSRFDANGKLEEEITYKYADGKVTEKSIETNKDGDFMTITQKYKYDANGYPIPPENNVLSSLLRKISRYGRFLLQSGKEGN